MVGSLGGHSKVSLFLHVVSSASPLLITFFVYLKGRLCAALTGSQRLSVVLLRSESEYRGVPLPSGPLGGMAPERLGQELPYSYPSTVKGRVEVLKPRLNPL